MGVSEEIKKARFVEKWASKGPDETAKRLYRVQGDLNDAGKELLNARQEKRAAEAERDRLLEENEVLKDVLQENGIRPKKLLVEYLEEDCKNCEFADYSRCWCNGEEPECSADENEWYEDEDPCEYKIATETIGFYTYKIDEGELDGITSDFRRRNYIVTKITNMETGRIVYESKEDEEKSDR